MSVPVSLIARNDVCNLQGFSVGEIFLEFFDQFFFAGTGFSEGGGLGK